MAPSTRANGRTTKELEKVSILSRMADTMTVSGWMEKGQVRG